MMNLYRSILKFIINHHHINNINNTNKFSSKCNNNFINNSNNNFSNHKSLHNQLSNNSKLSRNTFTLRLISLWMVDQEDYQLVKIFVLIVNDLLCKWWATFFLPKKISQMEYIFRTKLFHRKPCESWIESVGLVWLWILNGNLNCEWLDIEFMNEKLWNLISSVINIQIISAWRCSIFKSTKAPQNTTHEKKSHSSCTESRIKKGTVWENNSRWIALLAPSQHFNNKSNF